MTLSTLHGPRLLQSPLLSKLLSALAVSLLLTSSLQRLTAQTPPPPLVNVTTYHNDQARTGLNNQETLLTLANVNTNTFGLLFTLPVDSYVSAQPLYLSQVAIPGNGIHNVVYIATENNSVYAFDADSNLGANAQPLWKVNLGPPVPYVDENSYSLYPSSGITSTPVIDTSTKTIFVAAMTQQTDPFGNPIFAWRLHALDVTTGLEKLKPVVISASVPGTGDGTDGNGNVPFNPQVQLNRPALLLAPFTRIAPSGKPDTRGTVFIAFASFGDLGPYHGWVFGYDANTLKQVAVFNTTPNAVSADPGGNPIAAGGIWMSGAGLASDRTSLYYITGNGTFDPSTGSFGDSFVRMSTTNGLQLADYFAPFNQLAMDDNDEDLGSGGCIVLPPIVGSKQHPNLMVGAGKLGSIYLVDRTNMGQFNAVSNNVVQEVDGQMGGGWGGPAYFNHMIYYAGSNDNLKAFSISNGVLSTTPVSVSGTQYSFTGSSVSVSSNGTSNGIVWAIDTSGFATGAGAVLHAYNAANLAMELYNNNMVPGRDVMFQPVHFITPTIANGKVYVAGKYGVGVYGEGQWAITPTIVSPVPGTYSDPITVTLTDTTPGASIYYTLHGAKPSNISFHYTGPFTLSSSAYLQAIAYAPGYGHSGIATAEFLVAPAIGNGVGLLGSYYANTQTPSGTATDVQVDPTINFNWHGLSPGTPPFSSFPGTNWSAEWNGTIEAETTDNVTFTTVSNDGVRLWVNNQELINEWVDVTLGQTSQTSQTYSASIKLVAGTLYPIKIDYYQDTGGSSLQLFWSFPGQPMQIVPNSQLYP